MKQGFTLIETLVAVFILTMGIIATSTVTQRNLQGAFYAKDQIVAYFLAEEAVEVIRNIRDTNVLRGTDWLNNLPVPSTLNQSVNVCVQNNVGIPGLVTCPSGNRLTYSETTGYGHTSGDTASRYARQTTLTRRAENEVEIKVTITWSNTLASNKSFTIYKSIFKR